MGYDEGAMAHSAAHPAPASPSFAAALSRVALGLVGAGGLLAGISLHQAGEAARAEATLVVAGAHAESRAVARSGRPTGVALDALTPELASLQARHAAWTDRRRHVEVDRAAGTLALVEDSFILRSGPATVGDRIAIAGGCDACSTFEVPAPLDPGVRSVSGRVGRGIFYQPGIIERLEAPWPDGEPIPPDLSGAAVLSDGTIVYSVGGTPWALPPARAGTIALPEREIFAMLSAMEEGMPVYVW